MCYKYYHIVLVVILLSSCGGGAGEKKNCEDFSTQPAAQSYFNSNNASNLDRDNDGIACEHLPDNQRMENAFDLTSFIGSYSLIGESCDNGGCSVQVVQLEVLSAKTLSFCVSENLESDCSYENAVVINASNINGNSFLIPNGEVQFGSIDNGHVRLKLNEAAYYGQGVLHTDLLGNGYYNLNGILLEDHEKYSLSSKAGRTVSWDKTNGIKLSSN